MATELPVENVEEGSSLTALYIGDLDLTVTEEELSRYFQQKGDVDSVKICRDQTEQPLGYGYVNFRNPQDAKRATEDLNFTLLNGKAIRISYSDNNPSYRRNSAANIFVKNLHQTIDNKELHNMFSKYGDIVSSKIETDSSGESKGFGYVQFKNEESAQRSIEELNGVFLCGLEVYVGRFVSKLDRQMSIDKNKFTNVFVKNLSESTTEHDLRNRFSEFGAVRSVAVMREIDGKSKCFGFVSFEKDEDASKSVELLNGIEFDGKKWFVARAQKKKERESELKDAQERSGLNNLYVKNLDDEIDDDKLKYLFSPIGNITSCKVMCDEKGVNKGYGFVALSTSQEASKAISELNGKMVGRKPLYVAIAEKKEARQERFKAIFGSKLPHTIMPAVAPHVPVYPPHRGPGLGLYPQAPMHQFVPGTRPIFPNMLLPMVHRPPPGAYPILHQQMLPRGNAFPLPTGYGMPNVYVQGGGTLVQGEIGMSKVHQKRVSGSTSVGALASALANVSPANRRQMLGEKLFPLVEEIEHEMAPKVTGMLLEMDQAEVIRLLESPESLRAKVGEAVAALREAPADQLASLLLN